MVRPVFQIIGLSLPIDESEDYKLSIKELANEFLVEGLKEWEVGAVGWSEEGESIEGVSGEYIVVVDQEEVEDLEEEINFHYE